MWYECRLKELCLHTKLLAPVNTMIADFLAKAPDPPAFLLTRNAVHVLKVSTVIVETFCYSLNHVLDCCHYAAGLLFHGSHGLDRAPAGPRGKSFRDCWRGPR